MLFRPDVELPNGFYGLDSIFLLLALARIRSLEQLRYEAPGECGKLLGLDRTPEVRTLRAKLKRLCQDSAFQSKPYRLQEWRTPENNREERLNYCQRMRNWRNAQETVEWLHAQLVSFESCQEGGNDVP